MVGVRWICSDFGRETLCSGVKQCAEGGLEMLFKSDSCKIINLIEISGPSDFCGFLVGYIWVKDGFVVLAIVN